MRDHRTARRRVTLRLMAGSGERLNKESGGGRGAAARQDDDDDDGLPRRTVTATTSPPYSTVPSVLYVQSTDGHQLDGSGIPTLFHRIKRVLCGRTAAK